MKTLINLLFSIILLVNFLPVNAQDLNFNLGKLDSLYEESKHDLIKNNLNVNSEESDIDSASDSDKPAILKGHVTKIPSGTKLKIIVETPIDELASKVDDEVSFRIAEDLLVDEAIVVPAGSILVGKLTEVNPAKRLHKSGSTRIDFKSLTLPDGIQVSVVASVLTHSGLLKGKFTKKNILLSSASIIGPTAAGVGAGLVADSSVLGLGIGAAAGAVAGLALYSFQKGNMVDIKAGDEMEIELTEEALVPALVSESENVIEDGQKTFCELK